MSDLKPGRELDALVAEKVMGWTRHETHPFASTPGNVIVDALLTDVSESLLGYKPKPFAGPWFVAPGMKSCSEEVPEYSTDIAAAWEVVEKVGRKLGNTFEVGRTEPNGKLIYCSFSIEVRKGEEGYPYARFLAKSETAPHAICLAALKAVG